MKRIAAFISCICIFISLVGCANNASAQSNNISHNTFDEAKAISLVIKDHQDFPSSQSNTVTKKLPTGGPKGTTANVKFITKVEKVGESTFEVTLTKDWGITVNGKYVKSSWKYNVTKNNVSLLESIDNDNLPNEMK
jgi:hypothetical protein